MTPMRRTITIERLSRPVSTSDLRALASLLVDAVDSGAAVSFVAPLTVDAAEHWWRATVENAEKGICLYVARNGEGIIGTVQMHPAWAPNQPQRAEIAKLIVHSQARRCGIGVRLMEAIERAARDAGIRLLTLDAKRGSGADDLYRRLGWIEVGVIPEFAVDPDGVTPHDAVIFYKRLTDTHAARRP